MSTIREIWRFPVKSMRGEKVAEARVNQMGIEFDRGWGITDLATDLTLTARRAPELLLASAHIVDETVVVTLPGGQETADDAVLSAWLERDVEVRQANSDGH